MLERGEQVTPDRPPRYIVESILGKGATNIQRLEAEVEYYCGLTGEWAKVATANALVELVTAKRVTMFQPGCYMLSPSTPMTEKKEPKTIAGYRNYSKEDVTPRTGSPGLTEADE